MGNIQKQKKMPNVMANDPVVKHHYETLKKGQEVVQNGKTSTVVTMIVKDPRLNKGKPTLIPSLYDGKIYKNEYDAVTQALKTGVKYTSRDTVEELDLLDRRLHQMYIK